MGIYTATNLPSDGETIDAADVNTDLQGLIDEFNGNIENSNIKSTAAIAFSKLAADAWTDYTPSWTASSGTAPDIGNGTLSGRYVKIGRIMVAEVYWQAGSTTNFGSAGIWYFGLPSASAATTARPVGAVRITDSGVGHYTGICELSSAVGSSGSSVIIYHSATPASQAIGYGYPITWANGDVISFSITYETS